MAIQDGRNGVFLAENSTVANPTRSPFFGPRHRVLHVYKCVEVVGGTCHMQVSRGDPAQRRREKEQREYLAALKHYEAAQTLVAQSRPVGGTRSEFTREERLAIQQDVEPFNSAPRGQYGQHYASRDTLASGWYNGKPVGVENRTRINDSDREKAEVEAARRALGGDLYGKDESPSVPVLRNPSARQQAQREAEALAVADAFRISEQLQSERAFHAREAPAAPTLSSVSYLPQAMSSGAQNAGLAAGGSAAKITTDSKQFKIPTVKPMGAPAALHSIGLPANASQYTNPRENGAAYPGAGKSPEHTRSRANYAEYSGSRGSSAGKSPDARHTRADGKKRHETESRAADTSHRNLHPKKRHIATVDVKAGPLTVKEGWFKNLAGKFEHPTKGVHNKPEYDMQPGFYFDSNRHLWVRPANATQNFLEETSMSAPYAVNAPWQKKLSNGGDVYYYNTLTCTGEWPPHGKTR